jgi:hypothetical protein
VIRAKVKLKNPQWYTGIRFTCKEDSFPGMEYTILPMNSDRKIPITWEKGIFSGEDAYYDPTEIENELLHNDFWIPINWNRDENKSNNKTSS